MELLVGRGVEVLWPHHPLPHVAGGRRHPFLAWQVLWPHEAEWYKALVQAYNPRNGKHFLLYVDGDRTRAPPH